MGKCIITNIAMAADGGSIAVAMLVDDKEYSVRAMNRTDGNKDIVVNGMVNDPASMKNAVALLRNYELGAELSGHSDNVVELVKIVLDRIGSIHLKPGELSGMKKVLKGAFERFFYEGNPDVKWDKYALKVLLKHESSAEDPSGLPEVQDFLREWERLGHVQLFPSGEVKVLKTGMPL